MAKLKHKPKVRVKKSPRKEKVKGHTAKADSVKVALWKKEVEELQKEIFSSVDDAIYSLSDRILLRLSTPSEIEAESREFMFELLSCDEDLVRFLKNSLKIKEI